MALTVTRGKPKKYLWTPNGGAAWYVRRKGEYIRISAAPGTPEFDRAYWDIMQGRGPAKAVKTSWRALWLAYVQGPWWAELKPRTRADYRKIAEYLLELNGEGDVTRAKRADVVAAMDANRDRVRFANYLKSFLSVLFSYAQHLGWREDNPASGIRALKMPASRKAAHLPWTDEAVATWRAKATPRCLLMFELGLGSVQRPGDWPRFTWGDYDGAALKVVQGKTGRALHLPCTAQLKAALDAARPDPCNPAAHILQAHGGGPVSYFALAHAMRKERARLGLLAYDLHALRYRGVMELAWSGCSDEEIEAFSGHASKAMVRKYAGTARQVMRARSAAQKRDGNG